MVLQNSYHLYHHFPDLNVCTVIGGVSLISGILVLSAVIGYVTEGVISRRRDMHVGVLAR